MRNPYTLNPTLETLAGSGMRSIWHSRENTRDLLGNHYSRELKKVSGKGCVTLETLPASFPESPPFSGKIFKKWGGVNLSGLSREVPQTPVVLGKSEKKSIFFQLPRNFPLSHLFP
jgi:hypothetical protein